jgi:hypothetical protein
MSDQPDFGTDVATQFDFMEDYNKRGADPWNFDRVDYYDPATHTTRSVPAGAGSGGGGGAIPGWLTGSKSGASLGAGATGTTGALGTTTGTAAAAAGTPWWQSSVVPGILNAIIALKSMHDQGKKPNFYNAPQTPQDIWKEGKTRDEYDFFSKWWEQFLRGSSDLNPSWSMPNNDLGNPSFMGGIKVPTIDFTKVGSIGGNNTGAGTGPVSGPAPNTDTPPPPANQQQSMSSGIDWNAIKSYGSGAMDFVSKMQANGVDDAAIMASVKKIFGGNNDALTADRDPQNPFEAAMGGSMA